MAEIAVCFFASLEELDGKPVEDWTADDARYVLSLVEPGRITEPVVLAFICMLEEKAGIRPT